ncbi:MAG TPA: O-antigen ligase family protein [Spirochaetota bacterium]|nr:O-antigen ligase family protein [Spirochaetota bacterium]
MDFLTQQVFSSGYPPWLIYLAVLAVLPLVFFRPWYAFLVSLFFFSARNTQAAVLTRTPFFGPYLNANDAFLWIAFFSAFAYLLQKKKVILPAKRIGWVFLPLLIGDLQSLALYGAEEYVLRAIWGSSIFPLMFFIGAIMMDSPAKFKSFFWVLFVGNVVGAIQHIVFLSFVSQNFTLVTNSAVVRTIGYMFNGGVFVIVGALLVPFKARAGVRYLLYIAGVLLIAFSVLMHQTRQVYVNFVISFSFMFLLFRRYIRIEKSLVKFILVVLITPTIAVFAFPNWNFSEMMRTRFATLVNADQFLESAATRLHGLETEIELWRNSPVLIGVGAAYPPELTEAYREGDRGAKEATGALNHVVIFSYLAHYGLIGAVLLPILLPLMAIRRLVSISHALHYDFYRSFIFMVCATNVFMDFFGILGSILNIAATSHMTGLLYGVVWGGAFHGSKSSEGVTL